MKKKAILSILALLVIVVTIFNFVKANNSIVQANEDVKAAYSQLETVLQRRSDLIPNLVETVKGYSEHEKEVFSTIAEARSSLSNSLQSGDLDSVQEANSNLTTAIYSLISIKESYPDLKADESFLSFTDELAGSENRIAFARQEYNERVSIYNTMIKKFPMSIVAMVGNFEEVQYFEADDSAKDAPNVNFE